MLYDRHAAGGVYTVAGLWVEGRICFYVLLCVCMCIQNITETRSHVHTQDMCIQIYTPTHCVHHHPTHTQAVVSPIHTPKPPPTTSTPSRPPTPPSATTHTQHHPSVSPSPAKQHGAALGTRSSRAFGQVVVVGSGVGGGGGGGGSMGGQAGQASPGMNVSGCE